jgi:PAS domain S-box-containing protein
LLAAVTNYTYSVTLEDGMPVSTDHSRGCLSVTGYSPEEYQADPYLWINMVHPDDQETVRQYVAAILGGKRVSAIEHRIIRRDGTIRWLRDTIVPHHDGEELVRYDGLVEDVTERRFAERTLQERELQLVAAQKIQQRLLPTESPRLPGFDIGGKAYAAEFTAGDFFDYLAMPNGTKGFVIGDVLGHGFSSALLMASTSTLVRMLAETHTEVGEILEKVNRFLTKETDDTFITVLLACLDPATRSFVYASGGHTPGYILDASGAVKVRLDSTSMPLAVSAEMQFPVAEPIVLERGNLVLLLTDGIQEAMSPDGKPLGITPVLDVVRTKRAQAADEIVESLHRLVCDFCQSEKPIDDLTAMVIKVET